MVSVGDDHLRLAAHGEGLRPEKRDDESSGGSSIGTVNFVTALSNGGSTYFSLEGPPTAGTSGLTVTLGATPEPSSLILLGTGALGVAGSLRRRFANLKA